jgi:hypothetical protein
MEKWKQGRYWPGALFEALFTHLYVQIKIMGLVNLRPPTTVFFKRQATLSAR